jgi:hypothetical protein
MPDADYSSIGPLDAAAQKEAWSLIGLVILDMIVVVAAVWIVGTIANSMWTATAADRNLRARARNPRFPRNSRFLRQDLLR